MNDVNRPLIAKPSWGVLIVWDMSWFNILKAKFLRNTTYMKVKIPKLLFLLMEISFGWQGFAKGSCKVVVCTEVPLDPYYSRV